MNNLSEEEIKEIVNAIEKGMSIGYFNNISQDDFEKICEELKKRGWLENE